MNFNGISEYPLVIYIATLVSIIALVVTCITLLAIYIRRIKTDKQKKEERLAEDRILKELSEGFLIYDEISQIPEEELKIVIGKLNKLKNTSFIFRKMLIKILVHFRLNLTGTIVEIINSTYTWLNLKEFTLSKLKSDSWFKRLQGLQEVNDNNTLSEVYKLVNDPNIDVRVTTYTTLINLRRDDAFLFLKNETAQLSEWHQIFLIDAIGKVTDLNIPEFKSYLNTKNQSILLMVLKLIVHYKQFNAIPDIIGLLDDKDEIIRSQAIYTLGALNAESAEEKLMQIYSTEHNKNKSMILHALGSIASGMALGFIKDKFLHADHYSLLKSAAEAISLHSVKLRQETISSFARLDTEQTAMIKHVQEPLNLYGIH